MSRDVRKGQQLGHFEVLEPLGAGGMGQVWRARDLQLKRDVALKLLPERLASDADAMLRFRREAELMAAVEHPNVASIFAIEHADVGDHEVTFLVMELVEGQTLDDRLSEGLLDVCDASQIGVQIAGALQAAHERGVVHRDLKPANVMLGPRGAVKVLDFGIAKSVAGDAEGSLTSTPTAFDATATGTLIGTAPYMSPEQVRGRPVDARTDIWALGCVLYEMLTGGRAFDGETPGDVLAAVVSDEPRWDRLPDTLPDPVAALLRGCLQKDPDDRTWTAAEARRTLESGSDPSATATRPASRLRYAAATLVVAAIVWLASGIGQDSGGPGADGRTIDQLTSLVALPPTIEGDADTLFFGAHQSISNRLASLPGMQVKEPPSPNEIAAFGGDLGRIAQEVRVDGLVRSAVTVHPTGTILAVRVVDPLTDVLLWAGEYATSDTSPRAAIARAGDELRRALRPDGPAPEPRPSADPQALAMLDVGRVFARNYNNGHLQDDYDRASAALQEALELDASLAEAAAELGMLAQYRIEAGHPSAVDDLGQWAELAVRRDPASAAAWAVKTVWDIRRTGSPLEALPAALRGAALGPEQGLPLFALGQVMSFFSIRLALATLERGVALDPMHLYLRMGLGAHQWAAGSVPVAEYLDDYAYAFDREPDNVPFAFSYASGLAISEQYERMEEVLAQGRASADRFAAGYLDFFELMFDIHRSLVADPHRAPADLVERFVARAPESDDTQRFMMLFATRDLARAGHIAEAERLMDATLSNEQLLLAWDVYFDHPDLRALEGTDMMARLLSVTRARLDPALDLLERTRLAGDLPEHLLDPYLDLRARVEQYDLEGRPG